MLFNKRSRNRKSLCFIITFTEPHAAKKKEAKIWGSSEADAKKRFGELLRRATIETMELAKENIPA